ncbi:MAG: alpha/beta fold hydrolase [Actinomycetota bacterium]|nr:alpha/beta fold hydrolase [Actinomycetota bacterium]MDQ3574514.1 alpha/beta fold hydrolase [Actinomycetota bacterium]
MARRNPGQAVGTYLRQYVLAPRYRREQRLGLTTQDGVRLSAWRIEGPLSAPCTIVLVHGFTNWSRSPRVHAFAQLLSQHFHVVVPDLRGHGHSEGTCSMGRYEPLDVDAAVRAAPPGLPVVTVGMSLGGAIVLVHAGAYGGVAGLVAISAPSGWSEGGRAGFTRVQRAVSGRGGRLLLATLARTRMGMDCEGLPDASTAIRPAAPAFTIVVHDPDDCYFGPEHAERIYEWAPEPKELWWRPGEGHGTDLLTPTLAATLASEITARVRTDAGPASRH